MNKSGPVIIIEDDLDDQEILTDVFNELRYKNKIIFINDGEQALEYLNNNNEQPFLILSDVNMPRISGFELRKKVLENERLSRKCIPFLFFTTSASINDVIEAYTMSAQGIFFKRNSYESLKETIRKIMDYWGECMAPND